MTPFACISLATADSDSPVRHRDDDVLALAVEDRVDLQGEPHHHDDDDDNEARENSAQRLTQH